MKYKIGDYVKFNQMVWKIDDVNEEHHGWPNSYSLTIDLVYNDKEDCYSEVIITGPERNIQALVYDGMFEDLVDLTNGTTEQIYDEQHGQEYYGPWDW